MININLTTINLEKIASGSRANKVIVIALICIMELLLGYYFILHSQLQRLQQIQQQNYALQQQIASQQQEVAKLPLYKNQLQQARAMFADLLQRLPNAIAIPNLLEAISRLGFANGLTFQSFKPLTEQVDKEFVKAPVQIAVTGNYHQLAHFINQLATLPWIVTLEGFTLAPINDSKLTTESLMMQLTLQTYRYEQKDDIVTLKTKAPAMPKAVMQYQADNLRSPFQPAVDRSVITQPLQAFALTALRMVGVLHKQNKIWALLATPSNKVYPVAVGDKLGLQQGLVMEITQDRVLVVETVTEAGSVRKHEVLLRLSRVD